MSDLHPPLLDPTTNGTNPSGPTDLLPSGPTDLHPSASAPAFAAAAAVASSAAPPPKRQRRPSVRLGDIGEQPAASDPYLHRHRLKQPFKLPPPFSTSAGPTTKNNPSAATKTRTLSLHHPNPNSPDDNDTNLETLAASMRGGRNPNPKFPRRSRKIRSSWTSSKPEEDEGFRSEFDDLRRDDSLSPRADPPSETDGGRDLNEENYNGYIGLDEDGGVRSWLNRLGLGRYAPVFEIHEVDDEVLPLLTLEDLKDMGINAVGSRRKMYCAIQKLKKNF